MNKQHKKILDLITYYLEKNPNQRFTQAIFNLNINQFKHELINGQNHVYELRDPYNDSDKEVLSRIKEQLNRFDNYSDQ